MTAWAQPSRMTEQEAMDFLYANMSLPDSADYPRGFYEANVRATFDAMREMPWGESVPEQEFKHFVLPVRVNNENMDLSRPVLYNELRDRVKNLSMSEAILEVNRWCHEKATYQPSDARTRGPLATIRSALGRCGEESTLGVAALRAVGIPARQIYTPRWAHTDDNHAWVEAWADGRWHFLGACEPEPILDLGWFNAPAARGMLMTTKVFGRYDGPEEKISENPILTVINITDHYAATDTIHVRAVYPGGRPAAGAAVDFCLYNYAEFYTVATKKADSRGNASLVAGMGDMIVWATDGERFGYVKANASAPAVVELKYHGRFTRTDSLDITPPPISAEHPAVTAEQRALNDRLKARGDSIRQAYTSTFATSDDAARLAAELALDESELTPLLVNARGNRAVIESFLRRTPQAERAKALALLGAIAPKDLTDVTAEVLADHLATPDGDSPLYVGYVLNPRVESEMLTPYKSLFGNEIHDKDKYRRDPRLWAAWVAENIAVDNIRNPMGLRMSPGAVWRTRRADAISRDIFFVASARAMGIPARIDPVSGKTQYAGNDGNWIDVTTDTKVTGPGTLTLDYDNGSRRTEPRYYSHFTVARIAGGRLSTLNHDEFAAIEAVNAKQSGETDPGEYMLMTGQRMADGSVLAKIDFAPVDESGTTHMPLKVRHSDSAVSVLGSFNSENIYHDTSDDADRSLLSTTGRGYYILGLVRPSHEPSAHALNDISVERAGFERWGKKIVLLLPGDCSASHIDTTLFPDLPSTAVTGTDPEGKLAAEIVESLGLTPDELPIFIIADTFNRVVYVQQGYSIGLGHKLLNVIGQLAE